MHIFILTRYFSFLEALTMRNRPPGVIADGFYFLNCWNCFKNKKVTDIVRTKNIDTVFKKKCERETLPSSAQNCSGADSTRAKLAKVTNLGDFWSFVDDFWSQRCRERFCWPANVPADIPGRLRVSARASGRLVVDFCLKNRPFPSIWEGLGR